MTAPRRERAEELFHLAADLEGPLRASFLDDACGNDAELRREVEGLLRQLDEQPDFLETPLTLDGRGPGSPGTPSPLDRVGAYRILEPIGEGGFGSVFLAQQEAPVRRRVALKIVKLGMDTREVVARFEAERQALACMDHPSVARVFDGGATESGRPYFVMEYVPGQPITDYCDTHRLPLRDRLELLVLVCQAVQHAHQKGIVHRDLKPSNVLVTERDGRPVPKVIDFGIARATRTEHGERGLRTEAGQLLGTFRYMSPEQADPQAGIDTRTDVYSLGVLLYELLTGLLPFDWQDPTSAADLATFLRRVDPAKPSTRLLRAGRDLERRASARGTGPRALLRRLQGDLDWIALRALEPDRSRRYASASELAADLERHLRDEPVSAGPPGAAYRVGKFVRRNRITVVAATVALLALVGGLVGTLAALAAARTAEDRARHEAARANETKEYLVEILRAGNPDQPLFESVPASHVAREIRLVDVLERASTDFHGRFTNSPEVELELRGVLGRACFGLGAWETAEPHLRRAVELGRETLGPAHESTLEAMGHLARVLCWRARYDEALDLAAEASRLAREHLGPEHRLTLHLTGFWIWYSSLAGREPERVLDLVRELVDTAERALGPDDRQTILLRTIAARLLPGPEEEPFARETVMRAVRVLGADHYLTAVARFLHANALAAAGRPAEAEALRRLSIAGYERHLGSNHPLTATFRADLAGDLYLQERFEEAREHYERALPSVVAAFGEDALESARHHHEFARVLQASGDPNRAAEQYQLALAGRREHLDPVHPWTLDSYRGLVRTTTDATDPRPVLERELRAVRALLVRELGADAPRSLRASQDLAHHLWSRGLAEDAEPIARAVVEGASRLEPPQEDLLSRALDTWASALRDTGRPQEARAVLERIEGRTPTR